MLLGSSVSIAKTSARTDSSGIIAHRNVTVNQIIVLTVILLPVVAPASLNGKVCNLKVEFIDRSTNSNFYFLNLSLREKNIIYILFPLIANQLINQLPK